MILPPGGPKASWPSLRLLLVSGGYQGFPPSDKLVGEGVQGGPGGIPGGRGINL